MAGFEGVTVADLVRMWSTTEHWRSAAEFPGYQVSSFGRVRGKAGALLRPGVGTTGYQLVILSRDLKPHTVTVHRLVLLTFFGPPTFVDAVGAHNDGDKLNNNVGNLRWATLGDNAHDRRRHMTAYVGSEVYAAKLREADIPEIRRRIAAGERHQVIADTYGVSKSNISAIKRRTSWVHVP